MLVFLGLGGILFFTSVGIMLSPLFFNISVADLLEMSEDGNLQMNVEVLKFLQGFTTIGTFMVPGLIGAYLFSETPSDYLEVNSFPPRAGLVTLLVVLMTLAGTTISDALYRLSKAFDWPQSLDFFREIVDRTEVMMGEQMESFLQMENFGDFAEVFFIMAILPAVCEETLFRGALQPVMKKLTGNKHLGIWLTAFLFSLLHQQFYTFLSILALGAVLGYIKEWSRSLWVPILMHLVNNGSIVLAIYFWDLSYSEVNELSGDWQLEYAIPGIAIFVLCFVLLYRMLGRRNV